jgi:hypothetical protein
MFLGINLEGWLTILAVLLSPLVALEVQRRLEEHRERRNRKLTIFRNLMTTRASRMAALHIEALNSIEVEFYAKSGPDKEVLDAWREYSSHLYQPDNLLGDDLKRWGEKQDDLVVDLLHTMANNLGYDIDKVTIRKNGYYPKGYIEVENELHALRKVALEVFGGKRPLPMAIVGPVEVGETAYVVSNTEGTPVTTVVKSVPLAERNKQG